MILKTLLLQNFRSYLERSFEFSPQTNLILGPNGSGKTNIIEAIYLLSTGKSFRSSSLSNLINWNQAFATIQAVTDLSNLEVRLLQSVNGSTHIQRQFFIDQVEKSRKAYLGSLITVVFHPEDIRLVAGSPSRRRELLDNIFSAFEWRYASALSQYHRALKHRNQLLDLIRIGKSSKNELYYWDQSMIKNDEVVHSYRQKFITHLNHFFVSHPSPQIAALSLNYHPSYLTSQKLAQNYPHELESGYTQSGLHRDDYSFDNSIFPSIDKNLAFWGSRGQQRLAVLALRLGQIDYFEQTYHQKPILLLDDIFSELDSEYRHLVTKIYRSYQTIVTSSEPNTTSLLPQATIIQL